MPSRDYFLYFRDGNPPIFEFEDLDEAGNATELFQNPIFGDWCCNFRTSVGSSRLFIYKTTVDSPDGAWVGYWIDELEHQNLPQYVNDGLAMAFLLP